MPVCLIARASTVASTGPSALKYLVQDTAAVQPTDFSQCAFIGLTGADYASGSFFAAVSGAPGGAPAAFDPVAFGQFFGLGLAPTVSVWALAYGVGRLVKFINTR